MMSKNVEVWPWSSCIVSCIRPCQLSRRMTKLGSDGVPLALLPGALRETLSAQLLHDNVGSDGVPMSIRCDFPC